MGCISDAKLLNSVGAWRQAMGSLARAIAARQPPALDLGANPLFHGWALVVAAMVILLTRDPGKHQHLCNARGGAGCPVGHRAA